MQRLHAWALGLALAALGSGTVSAEQQSSRKQQAAALAAQGEQLGQDKFFNAALSKFKEAHALDPATPAYLCNIGNAYYALADYPRAHLYLSRCRAANGGTWPAGVREVFDYVEGSLSKQDYTPVTINGRPDGAHVDISFYADEGPSIAPVTLYVPFGRYEVTVTAEGHTPSKLSINATDRNPLAPSYVLSPAPVGSNAGTGSGTGSGSDTGTTGDLTGNGASFSTGGDISTGVSSTPREHKRWPVWLAIGGGVVASAGVITWFTAYHMSRNGCGAGVTTEECFDRMRTRERIGWPLMITGGVGAAAGLTLHFLQTPEKRERGLTVGASPIEGGGMVFMSFRK